jgi:chemotaxis family two-component system sensor kinase Cph1
VDFFRHLFTTDFMPHGYLRWDPSLLWLVVSSDAAVAFSCLAIPLAILQFVRKRKDLAHHGIFFAFAVFILAFGATHLLEIATLWKPLYRLDGLMKAITAVASMMTAVMLARVAPALLRLPSPYDLKLEKMRRLQSEQQLSQMNTRLEDLVRERTARIERYNQALERVAYIASHDLREPLNTVHTYAELLDQSIQGKLDEDERNLLDFILGGARRMQALIEGLLEYTRVVKTANVGENMAVPTSMDEAVQDAISVLENLIRQTGTDIRVDSGLPTVWSRLAPLRQIFQNLFSNAIKYRRPGEPVSIEVHAEVSGTLCMVTVQDYGIGLDMRYSTSIFEAFKRLHGPDVPGSGVGLALCKSIVESFGGTIWVESKGPGTGSSFRFTLPVKNGALSAAKPYPISGSRSR